ncbi:MAG: hypothetical protein GX829_11050 [Clostridium sp.]|nr:hypothetical protein [Clostridium sp.]
MDKSILKLPSLTILSALALRIINNNLIAQMVKDTNEWTIEMGNRLLLIDVILSLVIFFIIGITLRKTQDKSMILKSATLLVFYSIAILILEQVTQYYGIYNFSIALILYLPTELFTIITSLISNISPSESINIFFAIPALFAPYLFIPFGKNKHS